MATGQVSFHNPKLVRKVLVRERENAIVNRLNKTRVEKFPDLRAEKEDYLKSKRREERKDRDEQRAREKQEKREREQLKWQKEHAYDDLMTEENMETSNNQDRDPDFLDDFMWSRFHVSCRQKHPFSLKKCDQKANPLTLKLDLNRRIAIKHYLLPASCRWRKHLAVRRTNCSAKRERQREEKRHAKIVK